MQIDEICNSIDGFSAWNHAEKIRFFGWYLMRFMGQEYFSAAQVGKCFEQLRVAPPSLIQPFLDAMVNRKPPEALRNAKGFCLERRLYQTLDEKYGSRTATIHVHKLLSDLPAK